MTATYTFDILSTLDGYGSYTANADWGGYWGKQGPEFLDHRLAMYSTEQRMVFGANTYRQFAKRLGPSTEPDELDPVNARMRSLPTTVVGRQTSVATTGGRFPRPQYLRWAPLAAEPTRASYTDRTVMRAFPLSARNQRGLPGGSGPHGTPFGAVGLVSSARRRGILCQHPSDPALLMVPIENLKMAGHQ